MNSQILFHFLKIDAVERHRLASNLSKYVTNETFLEYFVMLNPNDINGKDKHQPTNLYFICGQLREFNDNPQIQQQVLAWLKG